VYAIRALRPRSRPIDLGTRLCTDSCSQTDIQAFALEKSTLGLKFSAGVPIERAVRATRAYLAGIGTAGALALGAALVFAAASAIIAFRGWPGTTGLTSPARQVLTVTPPPSPLARRVAHIATTAKHTAAGRHQATPGTQRTATHGRSTIAPVHHSRAGATPTHHQATTNPVPTTTHPVHRTHPARHTPPQPRRGGPLHSKSYPVNTTSATSAPTTTSPAPSAAPTVTTAVATTTSSAPTSTTPVGVKVDVGHGHTVTIAPETPTATTATMPTTIRPVTTSESSTTATSSTVATTPRYTPTAPVTTATQTNPGQSQPEGWAHGHDH
jgi:hypothetical protein